MNPTAIDPSRAFLALQQFTASEVARLYGEIAARDAFIAQLQDQLAERDGDS